jgi:hypothetical protein
MPDAVMLCLRCPRGWVIDNLRDAPVFCVRHGTLCPCYLEWLLLFKLQRPRSRVIISIQESDAVYHGDAGTLATATSAASCRVWYYVLLLCHKHETLIARFAHTLLPAVNLPQLRF